MSDLSEKMKDYRRSKLDIDPSVFDDPVAMKIEWWPMQYGGSNVCTYQLNGNWNKMVFRATLKVRIIVFMLIPWGLWMLFYAAPRAEGKEILVQVIGLIVTLVGIMATYQYSQPIVFDKRLGWFYHGYKAGKQLAITFGKTPKNATRLQDIHALQIISELVRGNRNTRSYYSYELNVVKRDGERMHVVDHGAYYSLIADAKKLSEFLDVPIWNAVDRDKCGPIPRAINTNTIK